GSCRRCGRGRDAWRRRRTRRARPPASASGPGRSWLLRRCSWVILSIEVQGVRDRKSTRLNSSHVSISYAVFCLKKKNIDMRGVVQLQNEAATQADDERVTALGGEVEGEDMRYACWWDDRKTADLEIGSTQLSNS